jgi:spore coat-associated protein N
MSTSATTRGTRHAGAFKTVAGIAATAIAGLAITSSGVYALLKAQAFNSREVAAVSGTLLLTLTDSANSKGFSQDLPLVAPGDQYSRYVQVQNAGSLPGTNLVLKLSDSATGSSTLTSDAVKGLQVKVDSCPTAWNVTTGACGTTATNVANTSAFAMKNAAVTLSSGAIAPAAVQYYKVTLIVPDVTEVSVNGVLPAGTIQNLTSSLRWTFTMDQRAANVTSD